MTTVKARYRTWDAAGHAPLCVETDVALQIDRTAFMLVDVMGASNPIIQNHIAPALYSARKSGMPIVYAANSAPRIALDRYEFTLQRHRSGHDHFPTLAAAPNVDPVEYHRGNGPWSEYCESVQPLKGDYLIKKVPYSGFHETRMDTLLRHLGITDIVACGFSAHMCLRGTLIDALYRNYRVLLLRDCTSGGDLLPSERSTKRFSTYMVEWMETYVGRSTTSKLLIEALGR